TPRRPPRTRRRRPPTPPRPTRRPPTRPRRGPPMDRRLPPGLRASPASRPTTTTTTTSEPECMPFWKDPFDADQIVRMDFSFETIIILLRIGLLPC
uniref:Uncharacterized protein n=1 Tax=Aegilops tauschii subsp. strangulata TaxID=200361 RepID=A0A453L1I5_AEGTS